MRKILDFIAHSNAAGAIAAAVLACVYVLTSHGYWPGSDGMVGNTVRWIDYLALVGCMLMGYLAAKPAVEYALTNIRTQLPVTLFLMGCTIAPLQVCTPRGLIILALLAIGCYVLLRTYRDPRSVGSYFTAFALVGLGTFIVPQLLWVTPLLLICCSILHSLCLRTATAALMGLLCVYWVAFVLLYVTDNMALIYDFIAQLQHYDWSCYLPPYAITDIFSSSTPLLWILLLVVPGSFTVLRNNALNLRSRTCYYYCIAVSGALLLLGAALPMLYHILLPLWLLLAAYIGMPLFVGADTRGKRTYAVVILFAWLILVTDTLWMRYIPF